MGNLSKTYFRAKRAAGTLLLVALTAPTLALGQAATVPGYFDLQNRLEKPDLGSLHTLRFLTDDTYPPFHFALADGTLTGFDIDLARAICEELKIACTIQARRFDLLENALNAGDGDALIASLRIDAASHTRFEFTAPYYTTPARFVARTGATFEATPEGLDGKTVGIIGGTAHEAYLKAFFFRMSGGRPSPIAANSTRRCAAARPTPFSTMPSHRASGLPVRTRTIAAPFAGGPYTDSNYFGEGVGIAVKKGNDDLRRALDYALVDLARRGVYTDIYLKYFPIGFLLRLLRDRLRDPAPRPAAAAQYRKPRRTGPACPLGK